MLEIEYSKLKAILLKMGFEYNDCLSEPRSGVYMFTRQREKITDIIEFSEVKRVK